MHGARLVVLVSYNGTGIGVLRRLWSEGKSILYCPLENVFYADVPTVEGASGTERVKNLMAILRRYGEQAFVWSDMVGALKKPIRVGEVIARTAGQVYAQIAKARQRHGIGIFEQAAAAERLELSRSVGAQVAAAVGMKVPQTEEFSSVQEALRFLETQKEHRFVFKPNENFLESFVPHDNLELMVFLNELQRRHGDKLSFVLQEFVDGVEVDIEGWFVEGELVPGSLNVTLETKRSLVGGYGVPVGCATTAQRVVSADSPLYRKSLALYLPLLRHWRYTGAFSVTTIVSKRNKEPYFLENCARLGWSAFLALTELHKEGKVSSFFTDVYERRSLEGRLRSGWGYGVRVFMSPAPTPPEAELPETKRLYRELERRVLKGKPLWGIQRASKKATVWLMDVERTAERVGEEPLYRAVGGTVLELTVYHERLKDAEKRIGDALDEIRGTGLVARVGDGADNAIARWNMLVEWGVVKPIEGSIAKESVQERDTSAQD